MMGLEAVCQLILGILDKEPLRNEPGWERGRDQGVTDFTEYVRYSRMRESIDLFYGPANQGEPVKELYGKEYYGMFQAEITAELEARRAKMIERLPLFRRNSVARKSKPTPRMIRVQKHSMVS